MVNNICIKKADIKNAKQIHSILLHAFKPYVNSYTKQAYQQTVLSPEIIKKRICNTKIVVLIALYNDSIIGTASIQKKNTDLYLFSMAVDPLYQTIGVGTLLMNEIKTRALDMGCKCIFLETYHRLKKAIKFYNKHGFRRTGNTRDYYGITVFEMKKGST